PEHDRSASVFDVATLARDLLAADDDATSPGSASPVLTRAGAAYGTPGYMAPEQARGQPADRRADVYSLGATLFFRLAGSPRDRPRPHGGRARAVGTARDRGAR